MTATTNAADVRRAELLALLGREAEKLTTGDGWLHWLEIARRMRTYSVNNQLLILAQRPGATQVAGFRAWQELGRQVRKGEHGIRILAPLVRRRDAEADVDGTSERIVVGFRIVSVFDIAQTDGPELPSKELPAVRVPDERLRDQLVIAARSAGFTVQFVGDDGSGARGWFEWKSNKITVVADYPLPSQIRTLLHELGHAFDPEVRTGESTRAEGELVAESAAYLVGSDLGLDMTEASAAYSASWGADQTRLITLATKVLAVARAVDALVAQLPLPGLSA